MKFAMSYVLCLMLSALSILQTVKAQSHTACVFAVAGIDAGIRSTYTGSRFEVSSRNTLHVRSFDQMVVTGCHYTVKVNIKISRKWRRDAVGSFILHGDITINGNEKCLTNIIGRSLSVSHTSAMESVYQRRVNDCLPDQVCSSDTATPPLCSRRRMAEEGGDLEAFLNNELEQHLRGSVANMETMDGAEDVEDEFVDEAEAGPI